MYNVITLDNNKVVGVKSLKDGYILGDNEINIPEYNADLLGKLYNPDTGEFTEDLSYIDEEARMWRDSELTRTDTLALLPDYPQAEALLVYRQALRDWTDSVDFPNVRPEMSVEVVQPEALTEPTEV